MSILSKINYQIYGPEAAESPPRQLVLLHGLMGTASNWMKVSNQLMKTYQILVFDQRGHGRSWQPKSGYATEDFAQDLLMLLDELNWQRPSILGHSMGGRNAFVFASKHPDRVAKLIVEDIGADANSMNVERMHRLMAAIPVPFADRKVAKRYFQNEFATGPGQEFDRPELLGKYLYGNLRKMEDASWDWQFSKQGILDAVREGRAFERWDDWQNLRCQTLLMRGEHSVELPEDVFLRMLEVQPLAVGRQIAGCGHWIHYEQPEMFMKTLVEFLEN